MWVTGSRAPHAQTELHDEAREEPLGLHPVIKGRAEPGLFGSFRIRHDLLRFGLLYSHRRFSSDTNWPRGDRQLRKCLAPAPRPFAAAPRGRSFPPEDRPPLLGLIGDGPVSDGHGGSSTDRTEILLYGL